MIKTGLYRVEDLQPQNVQGFFGGRRRASVTLYDKIGEIDNAEWWAEHILDLFSDAGGAWKRTHSKRFEEFDALVLQQVSEVFEGRSGLCVHDAAVSDGRTALDFFGKLARVFPNIVYYASDIENTLFVVEKNGIRVTLNRSGSVLEVVSPPFVFNLVRPENFFLYPINLICRMWVKRFQLRDVLDRYRSGNLKAMPLRLVCPHARRLADTDNRFRLIEQDLLKKTTFDRAVDIVRAMNVLNATYFNAQDLTLVIRNVFSSLIDGGLFIVGSNDDRDTTVRGGIYSKVGSQFISLVHAPRSHDAHNAILAFRG